MAVKTSPVDWLWAPLLVGAFALFALWHIARDYAETTATTYDRLQAMVRVVDSRTAQTFTAIESLLIEVRDGFDLRTPAGDGAYARYLQARGRINAEALTITIVSADGTILHSTASDLVGKAVGERSYLRHFRAHPDDHRLFVSEPIAGLLGRTIVFAALPLHDPDGRLRAIFVSSLSPGLFAAILEAALPTERTAAISLSNRDHLILARAPDLNGKAIGLSLATSPLMVAYQADRAANALQRGRGGVDGLDRMIALRTVEPYGLTVAVSVGTWEALRPFLRNTGVTLGMLALLAAVAATLARVQRLRQIQTAQAEADAVRARDHYMRILEDFPALIWRADAEGWRDWVNRRWQVFSGRPPVQDLGLGWRSRVHPADLPGVDARLAALAADHLPESEGEYRIMAQGGEYRWVHEVIRPLPPVDPAPDATGPGILGVCHDITDSRRIQDRLSATNAELEQFAYVASHDLREPLRTISSYVSLIERRLKDTPDPALVEFITFARDGAVRMDRMVQDLLELSRIGRNEAPAAPVDCAATLATALGHLEVLLRDSGARVCVGTLPVVLGHEGELVRLFQNLIHNALKYARPGVAPRIVIDAEPGEGTGVPQVILAVSDNGIGIEPQHAERVFRVFQRLHGRDAHGGGSGIGLAVCRKIVEAHGGRIWVDSAGPDQGCTFRFTLRPAP